MLYIAGVHYMFVCVCVCVCARARVRVHVYLQLCLSCFEFSSSNTLRQCMQLNVINIMTIMCYIFWVSYSGFEEWQWTHKVA